MSVHQFPSRVGPNGDTITANCRRTLVRNPGTPAQRAVRVISRDHQREHAIDDARATYPGQPLGWLNHETNTIEEIPQ